MQPKRPTLEYPMAHPVSTKTEQTPAAIRASRNTPWPRGTHVGKTRDGRPVARVKGNGELKSSRLPLSSRLCPVRPNEGH